MSQVGLDHDNTPYSWDRRRKVMYFCLAFCVGVISFILWKGRTDPVSETAITMAFLTIGSIVGFYVGGAAWQDINHMKTVRGYGGGYGGYGRPPLRPGLRQVPDGVYGPPRQNEEEGQ